MDLTRPLAPNPYEMLPAVPAFSLTSTDLTAGGVMPAVHSVVGGDISPQLSWSGAPEGTRSYALTCFDPDAPTPAGFWHWTVLDISATTSELPQGSGESDLALDGAAFHLRNDGGDHSYMGAAPPKGDIPHRYIFAVHALDIESLDLDEDCSATAAAFKMLFHTIGRATLTVTFQTT